MTKYALRHGIYEAEAEVQGENAIVTGAYPWEQVVLKLGDWYRDPDKAIDRAKKMAVNEANKLERRAAELRNKDYVFSVSKR